jgi:hypothetical protein
MISSFIQNFLTIIFITIMAFGFSYYSSVFSFDNKNIFESFDYGISSFDITALPQSQRIISGPWIGSTWSKENEEWLSLFKDPKHSQKIPYINVYTIAGLASAKEGLKDCNVGADPQMTLCTNGANFIRSNKAEILLNHISTAESIKLNYGTSKNIILHFEPDFLQYSDNTQNGGGVAREELASLMNSWTSVYKTKIPNATFVMDISPWNYDLRGWSNMFENFEYGGLVGARFGTKIEGKDWNGKDFPTYKEMVELTGKKIIVNDSHGPGGKWLPYNPSWDEKSTVDKLFGDGVVAVIRPPN